MKKSKLFKGYVQTGQPKYSKGDKVIAGIISNDELIIESSFWNGFCWMYYFENSEFIPETEKATN